MRFLARFISACQNFESNNKTVNFLQRSVRAILVGGVLLSFAASTFPLTTIASGPMCTLSCCAGRAPHAAGSCMNGSCQAILGSRSKTSHQHSQTYTEKFCGLTHLRQRNRLLSLIAQSVARNGDDRTNQAEPNHDSISGGTIGKPCDPNCGGAFVSSSTQSRPRQFSASAYVDKPRPPTVRRHYNVGNRSRHLDGFGQQVSPRGPPVVLS